jgi:hypothetical protein
VYKWLNSGAADWFKMNLTNTRSEEITNNRVQL